VKQIRELRQSLSAPQRASMVQIVEETLEILESVAIRLHELVRNYEELD